MNIDNRKPVLNLVENALDVTIDINKYLDAEYSPNAKGTKFIVDDKDKQRLAQEEQRAKALEK